MGIVPHILALLAIRLSAKEAERTIAVGVPVMCAKASVRGSRKSARIGLPSL